MNIRGNPSPYGWRNGRTMQPPEEAAPPSYSQAVGGVGPSSYLPYTPQYPPTSGPAIVPPVVPVGPHPTLMICPTCQIEICSYMQTNPGLIAYISGTMNCMFCGNPPPYGWGNGHTMQPPPAAPPSYSQAVGGVGPSSPYTPQYPPTSGPAIVTTVVPVGPHPTHMICPSCHVEIDSYMQTKPGLIAYISGTMICMFGGFLGCCLIPCCINSCMDVHHTCPRCNAYLGRYRR